LIVLIDNYDSFTYNLYQYLSELGETVRVYRNDGVTLDSLNASRKNATGFVLSAGPGRPENAGVCGALVPAFANRGIPILGVCLGHQVIASCFGSRVGRCRRLMHGKASPVIHNGTGLFRGVDSPFLAGRYHSLCVEPDTLSPTLRVTARCGLDGTIMALEHRSLPLYGVQFHPESILTPAGKKILSNFLSIVSDS
jgi:anthranilate synthase/aminodeoxychorismate synthase-like glutamine amidotransferase